MRYAYIHCKVFYLTCTTAEAGSRLWNILLGHNFSHQKIVKQFSSRHCREFRLKARLVIFFNAFFFFFFYRTRTTSFYTSYSRVTVLPSLCRTSVLRGLFTTPTKQKKIYPHELLLFVTRKIPFFPSVG